MEEKPKNKISSVIADIGDPESSESDLEADKYFKESPKRELSKSLESNLNLKKSSSKTNVNVPKDKLKKQKQGDTFLEFDSVDSLKQKKRHKSNKPDKHEPLQSSDTEKKRSEKEPKLSKEARIKTSKKPKEINTSKKIVSSDDEKNSVKKKPTQFFEFDAINPVNKARKSEEKPAEPKPDPRYKTDDKRASSKKEKMKQLKEMKLEKTRKRSMSSLSSNTSDEEVKTPSSDVSVDEVAKIRQLPPAEKPPLKHDKNKNKDRKNKHKLVKSEPIAKPMPKPAALIEFEISNDNQRWTTASSSQKTKRKPRNSNSTGSMGRPVEKPPDFHRAPPVAPSSEPKLEKPSPPRATKPPEPSPASSSAAADHHHRHRHRVSESSSDLDPGSGAVESPTSSAPPNNPPSSDEALSPDHLKFMLNIYHKIYQLQKSGNKSAITQIVNILSDTSSSGMEVKDDNVTFDLVNCDVEVLKTIDNALSG